MFVLIFIAVVNGQHQERMQSFPSMSECQMVKRVLESEFKGSSRVRIQKLVCETKKKEK